MLIDQKASKIIHLKVVKEKILISNSYQRVIKFLFQLSVMQTPVANFALEKTLKDMFAKVTSHKIYPIKGTYHDDYTAIVILLIPFSSLLLLFTPVRLVFA